jgi:hypothetical protein
MKLKWPGKRVGFRRPIVLAEFQDRAIFAVEDCLDKICVISCSAFRLSRIQVLISSSVILRVYSLVLLALLTSFM